MKYESPKIEVIKFSLKSSILAVSNPVTIAPANSSNPIFTVDPDDFDPFA